MFALSVARVFASPVLAVVKSAAAVVVKVKQWHEARQAYRLLCELDDHNLADIGISRSDLRSATALGFTDNPTLALKAMAQDKRCAGRLKSCEAA